MKHEDEEDSDPRPQVAAEVRAWVIAAAALIIQMVGVVWWAATLSAQMQALREVVGDLKAQLSVAYSAGDAARDLTPLRATLTDHETRLRDLERKPRP